MGAFMSNKQTLLFIILLMFDVCFSQQWEFVDDFVEIDAAYGLEVDADDRIWVGAYYSNDTLISDTGSVPLYPIYVYNDDGTQASFSPINFLEYNSGIDTVMKCRGISKDHNGNILYSASRRVDSNAFLAKIDWRTGACINKWEFDESNSITTASSDSEGNIFVTSIVPGHPIYILDSNFVQIGVLDTLKATYQRDVLIVDNGLRYDVYVCPINPGVPGDIFRYHSNQGLEGPWTLDTLNIIPPGWTGGWINDSQFDNFGNLWVFFYGDSGGLFTYDTTDFTLVDGVGSYSSENGLRYFSGDTMAFVTDLGWSNDGRTMYSTDFRGKTIKRWFNPKPYGAPLVLNIDIQFSVEYSDSIILKYDIYNADDSPTNLLVEYKSNNSDEWTAATVTGDTSFVTQENYQGELVWNLNVDVPGVDQLFTLRVTPYTSESIGLSATVRNIHVDNNETAIIQISPVSGEQRLDIEISYLLSDTETDSLGLLCEFFDASSESWRTATTITDTSALINYDGQITWKSLPDLPTGYGEHLFRIIPYDNDPGTSDTITIFIDQLGLSVAGSISQYTTEESGDITVDFTVSDDEADPVDIKLDYSTDSGINWSIATVTGSTTGLTSNNYTGTITWLSNSDLTGIDSETIRLKLTPNDGNPGFPIETDDFHLDNNLPPQISVLSIPDSISVVASVAYSLIDAESDTLSLGIEYSTDQGHTWNSGIIASGLSTIFPENYSESFDWYSYESCGFQRLSDIWLRFSVSDNDPGSDTTLKGISILNYPAEYTGDLQINTDDLAIFASAWNADPQNVTYEIGPASGSVPELTPDPDGILDFEDLAVFVQMWNWSYENNGLARQTQLAKSNSESPSILEFDIEQPEDKWSSRGETSIAIHSDFGDLLQVEWILEHNGADITISSNEGSYFADRYEASPMMSTIGAEGKLSLFSVAGLGVLSEPSESNSIAEIKLSNQSGEDQSVTLYYRVWDSSAKIVESAQISLDVQSLIPDKYSLRQNFPNPFNPSTSIRYTLPENEDVKLIIYNIRGEEIRTMVSDYQTAGYYQMEWNGDDTQGRKAAAGLYFYRLTTPAFSDVRKMVFLK